jgi:endonuclease/exonuclease/phosphatase (EEP) superfamily protein YafD
MFRKVIGFIRNVLDGLWAVGGVTFAAAWWVGVVMKDRTPFTQLLFFIPPVLVVIMGGLWLFLTLRHRFRLIQLLMFATVYAALFKILVVDHRWNRAPEPDRDLIRVVHWNTASGILGVESIVTTLTRDQPHILMISEPPTHKELPAMAEYALGMPHILRHGPLTLASHYPLDNQRTIPLPGGTAFAADAYTLQGPLTLVGVDLISHPNLNRHPPLVALAEWLEENHEYPTLVLGDFNTPRNALAFRPLREAFHHAYEEAGRGWPYTWPFPVPVYAIDHAWLSEEVTAIDYVLKPARYSDHKRQVFDLHLIQPVNPDVEEESANPEDEA